MVKLFCAFVGKKGKAFSVDIDASESVDGLKKAIKVEKKNDCRDVDADNLQLFLAKKNDAWLTEKEGKEVQSTEGLTPLKYTTAKLQSVGLSDNDVGEVDEKDAALGNGSIHVLVSVLGKTTMTIDWTRAGADYPTLEFDNSAFIRVPNGYAVGSGLHLSGNKDMLLYRRPELEEEWQALQTNVVNTYALLWIVGPPGTGKSCVAFAFACSLDRSGWDILWISIDRSQQSLCWLSCVLFRDENEKQTCKIQPTQLSSLLQSLNENAIVFLDGYIKGEDEDTIKWCLGWRDLKKPSHRLVCVCSMVSLGNDWHPERYERIPHSVDTPLLKSKATVSTTTETGSSMKDQAIFQLTSWTLDDYERAVSNDIFFEHVKTSFTEPDDADSSVSLQMRMDLLEGSFSIAGGCARMMFELNTDEKTNEIWAALDATPDIGKYLDGALDINVATGAATQLFSWYAMPGFIHPQPYLLSRFVGRNLAMRLGTAHVVNIAKAMGNQRQATSVGQKRAKYQ